MDTVQDALQAFRFTNPADQEERLRRLAVEWDLDRASALLLSLLGILALPLARRHGGWIAPAALQALALLRFAGVGVDPIAWLLRPLGFRRREAIESERAVVSALRGRDGGLR